MAAGCDRNAMDGEILRCGGADNRSCFEDNPGMETIEQHPCRVLVLTFGSIDAASTKFRIVQYLDTLAAAGVHCDLVRAGEFRDFAGLPRYDVVLLQKTLLSAGTVRKLRRGSRRLLYDADDLIWLSPGKQHSFLTRLRVSHRLRTIVRAADICLAANGVIATDLAAAGGRTVVLPMALDGRIWQEPRRPPLPLTIGWSGAPHNIAFLRAILPQLREVQRRHPGVEWLFHSGADPQFSDFRYTHVPFVPGGEPETVGRFHIGLLPLPEDPFALGKSPIKSLQYFASRVAVAASPVGATTEIVRDGETGLWVRDPQQWPAVLERLITDDTLRERLAAAGRAEFEATYDLPRVADRLIALLRGVPPGA
jgi:hypothetical protein